MKKIKAVVFDMDGVLVDAKIWHFESLNFALKFHGFDIIPKDQHIQYYDGLPTKEKLKIHHQTKKLGLKWFDKINNTKQQHTFNTIKIKCQTNKGHLFTLGKLKDLGYRLAVCSNSVKKSVSMIMEQTCLLQYIEFFLSNEDVVKPKPFPEIYNNAISKMGLLPGEVLVCEDNINGIKSAIASGASVLEIQTIEDVNLKNIQMAIQVCEDSSKQMIIQCEREL